MATAMEVTIAEAVKDALNAQTFSMDFVAQRCSRVDVDLQDTDDVQVYVVSGLIELSGGSRRDDQRDYTIQIGIAKHIQQTGDFSDDNDRIDPLKLLAEEITDYFVDNRRLADLSSITSGGAVVLRTLNVVPWSQEALDVKNAFVAVLTVTFRLMK